MSSILQTKTIIFNLAQFFVNEIKRKKNNNPTWLSESRLYRTIIKFVSGSFDIIGMNRKKKNLSNKLQKKKCNFCLAVDSGVSFGFFYGKSHSIVNTRTKTCLQLARSI